ncbi:N-6 DNA methylase [Planktothrix mougeotii]|uniref:N-6 DNA methylase n=1 Tax=Planktothrix mougeotii LEGE 06226 TaxID=1828728 RepID=A0ABR9U5F9_9CYAN|nr:N-6 DNA methylase [Planktothrix mougeotii]MBE9141684.1 N-6 DNA methylase [Planktothrix mougeotii LEGE 06226]
MNLAYILKDSNYKLSQFNSREIEQLEQSIILKSSKSGEIPYTVCLVRKKDVKLTPEEAIRQLYLRVLTGRFHYPIDRIQVEYGVNFGREVKRADIVVMDKDRLNTVYIIIELKKPKLKDGKDQLRSYCNATGAPIAVWTNGDQISYYQRKDPNYFEDIPGLPNANQTLADILQIKFTLEDLIANDKLVKEKKSLKALIEEMEDEVLANAGVDVFEELFKLIFTKLYDEWYSGQGNRRKTRSLEFRNTGQTEAALKTKIQSLFDSAKKKWEGVFSDDAKISLTPSHLSVCVSSLENVKLFNSNLDVIDEAFEYLINQSSKGEKGQFFTPRYVIDMCVKMLNPQEDEYMIDTAAGSSGFPVHTIFHVWRQILEDEGLSASHLFSLEDKPPRCREYVEQKVFAIDFDEKAVRVARTLNLIAGDGQTNVLHLNTLDYEMWDEVTQQEDWQNVYFEGFKRLKKLRLKGSQDYREFQFDVLMANPPFAGDIKEPRMIARYDLAKKSDGKWQTKVGRDILFIERNLDFLKPGGRMAIVLPQGRFNNSSDKYIRDFIAERCRILAVVGLHGNTFKPHTGTKTSVLFVQKWNDDPKAGVLCPRQDDYNIFFATMQRSGKDNSGEKIYVKNSDESGEFLLDDNLHLIVDHDLFNHEGKTQDGIAEAFIEFAKKENLSFFKLSPSVTPFDAVKYQRLMDGLEAINLTLSEVLKENDVFRIDNDFFQKEFLLISKKFKNNHTLEEYTKSIVCGPFGSTIQDDTYQETGVIVVRPFNLVDFKVENTNLVYISENDIVKKGLKLFKKGTLFFSRVGDVRCSVLTQNEVTISPNIIAAELNNEQYSPYFLSIFFNSRFGMLQILRAVKTVAQPTISTDTVRRLKLPNISKQFQNQCEKLLLYAFEIEIKSQEFYQQAEDLLLSELNFKNWQPTEENIAVKSFKESFLSCDRLDAEYYHAKYDQAEKVIKDCGFPTQKLGSLIEPIQNGFDYREYTEEGTPYIRVGDIKNGLINLESAVKIPITMADVNKPVGLQLGDILFTRKGSFGNSAVVTEQEINGIISSEIMLIRLAPIYKEAILPEYVSLFLNSKFGYLQVERRVHGVAYYSISQPDLANVLIPILPKIQQQKIVEKIKSSFLLKQKSKQLLEIAKIGVEQAIETDEETATIWINQQLKLLGVNLKTTS